ncbi:MAG: FG-GAP repeat protein [Deltaproteobacteria bacterium]|nr:FG-GAP repeat protein [Deltaproteobacteria bacterium]
MIRRGMLFGLAIAVLGFFGCSDDTDVYLDGQVDLISDSPSDGGPEDGGDGPESCSLALNSINGTPVAEITAIGGALDKNDGELGIQIDVEVLGTGLADGVQVELSLTGQTAPSLATASGGKAIFSDVTVVTSIDRVRLGVSAAGCGDDSRTYTVEAPPECVFLTPRDGETLGQDDDKLSGNDTFDFDVVIKTTSALGGSISLGIDDMGAGVVDPIPGSGTVTFNDKVLSSGAVTLTAQVELNGVVGSCKAAVNVDVEQPICRLSFTPALVQLPGGENGLGVAQDALPSTTGIETNVAVETHAGATVTLEVDGAAGTPRTADGSGNAAFNAEPLADGERRVKALCVDTATGNRAESTEIVIKVDSQGPPAATQFSCTLTQPRLGRVTCQWTSAGPVEVASYLLRYATDASLTETSWAIAATTEKSVVPNNAGQTQSVIFEGLPLSATYYISLRAADGVLNLSALVGGDATVVDFRGGPLPGFPEPSNTTSQWGSVMVSGDFNCDGHTDLALGDPLASNNLGRVSIYLGSAAGYLPAPEKFINGTVAGGRFGAGLAMLPNFDGDAVGCSDLAVYASHGNDSTAQVFVYLGSEQFFDRNDVSTGKGAELIYSLPTLAGALEVLGERIANAGDFNGDGVTDLALSYRDTGANTASVLLVFGTQGLQKMNTGVSPTLVELPAAASARITGGTATGAFGLVLGGGASLDSDANADLLVGASHQGQGMVYVVKGGAGGDIPLTDARVIPLAGASDNVAFGAQVALVGDMNKDGTLEFAVSDPDADGEAGRVYVFNLLTPPSGPANAVMTLTNDVNAAAGDRFGLTIAAGSGDIDDDGRADLLVGSQQAGASLGVVYQFNGAATLGDGTTSQADYIFAPPSDAKSFGTHVVWAADINDDGFSDVAIADPLFLSSGQTVGRVHYYY